MRSDLISEESMSTLRLLLGVKVHTIFCPPLDAAGAHLAAWTLSILMEKGSFINFGCQWSETPKFLNDSWSISVEESTMPLNIVRNESGAFIGLSTISIYNAKLILSIEILETSEAIESEGLDESVHYDQAILFKCAEGRQFCICCMLKGPGIATYLHFSEDAEVIEKMTRHSTTRLVLADTKTK